jgi:hypothetical protein
VRPPSDVRVRRAARAFMAMDLLIALAAATAFLLSLSVALGAYRRAERGMAEARADCRRLEQGLLALQIGGTPDSELRTERLGNGPANLVWIRLTLPPSPLLRDQTNAALVGLVPADKAAGGVP